MSIAAFAQCPTPAPDDYPLIPFIGPTTVSIVTPLGSGCTMTFQYCWRTTPFGDIEIYIGAISTNPNGSPCNSLDDPNNVTNYINIASRAVIVDLHPWHTTDGGAGHTIQDTIFPCPKLSKPIYRILSASCYSVTFFDPTTGNIMTTP